MKNFDVQISMNGIKNELDSNFENLSGGQSINLSQLKKRHTKKDIEQLESNLKEEMLKFTEFEGNLDNVNNVDNVNNQEKKSWIDTLNNLTNKFKEVTDFKTNEQVEANRKKELAEKGKKYKILGMNPIVAIAVSFVFIIGGSVAIIKIKTQ